MQHIKCVVVGDGTVGKTCLLIAYTMKAYPQDYVPTVFDNYNAVVMWDGRPVNLGLWDTAGQDDFEAMRPMSYQSADIFLIFFAIDNPVSFQNVKHKWFPEITKVTKDTPRILVGTKMDCRDDPARLEQLAEKKIKPITFKQGKQLSQEIGCVSYIECSAIAKKGFRDVFGQTIAAMMNVNAGKKPGHDCWNTTCNNNFKLLSKKAKCVRCMHHFCGDCVVTLPKNHAFAGKSMCTKCKEIDDDEPLSREDGRKKKKSRNKEENGKSSSDEPKESKGSEAVPLSSSDITKAIAQAALTYKGIVDVDDDDDKEERERVDDEGKKKKDKGKKLRDSQTNGEKEQEQSKDKKKGKKNE